MEIAKRAVVSDQGTCSSKLSKMNSKRSNDVLATRLRIQSFWLNNCKSRKAFTVKHFTREGFTRQYIYKVISMVQAGESLTPKKITGAPKIKLSKKDLKKLKKLCQGKVCPSYRFLGRKFGVADKTIKRICEENGLIRKRRVIKPKVSPLQKISQKYRVKRLAFALKNSHLGKDLIMDDESYFKLYGHQDNHYYFEGQSGTDGSVKFIRKEKYEPKLMVWMLISARGASPAVIFPSKQSINGAFYREFIIKQVLKPFIDVHYPDANYWFWADLAPGHKAAETCSLLDELQIDYVEEDLNPPNAPQLRPIERFWAHLKRKVYKNGWEAQNLQQLKVKIEKVVRKIPISYYQNLMKNVNSKIFKAARMCTDAVN